MDRPAIDILGLSFQELTHLVEDLNEPRYRAKQLYQALYKDRVSSLDQISTLSNELKSKLVERGVKVGLPIIQKKFTSVDGTVRYLLEYADGQSVETVWMPEGDGGEAGDGSTAGDEEVAPPEKPGPTRATICVSSQVGCAVNCQFCMTALLGLKRNLTAGEIVGQVLVVLNDHQVDVQKKRINLVFMGQGEPFHNYDNFIKAVRLLVEAVRVPESRITVSTSGIVPRIADLGREPIRPKLAISLNASNDESRTKLIPINKKWNIAALLEAAKQFPLRRREKVTFEYVLLDHENDSVDNAREVVELLRGLDAKVNLIAWNSGPEIPFATPSDARVHAFQQTLRDAGIPAFIRRPRGRDIYAACGQLKRTAS
ncbi:MAG TPA: 23S rRNA (adenine(2503)-C(2))-methyltransferase RlmN [Terriglobales bacterium]|nr:23S rRNA (adenine(2503)-C(2))-methyltransferase RlmN [Terriglobales bacterium]